MKKIQIIGNVTRDAVIKEVGFKKVINFSVAVNERYIKDGQKQEKVSYYNCAVCKDNIPNKDTTSVAQYIKKGVKIFVEGNPDVEMYENREQQKVAVIKITVSHIELLGGVPTTTNSSQTSQAPGRQEDTLVPTPDDDLPF